MQDTEIVILRGGPKPDQVGRRSEFLLKESCTYFECSVVSYKLSEKVCAVKVNFQQSANATALFSGMSSPSAQDQAPFHSCKGRKTA